MLLEVNSPGGQQRLDTLNAADPHDGGSDELILPQQEGMSVRRLESFIEEISQQPPWRRQADLEADYFDGNQLTTNQISELEDRGFAPLITNLIQPTINMVLGMEAKTRTDWTVRAEDGEISEDMAMALSALLRKAESTSRADRALSDAYADQVKVGLGWVEVSRNADPFGSPYRVRRIHRREISWDWRSEEPDLSNARYLVRKRWVDEDTAVAAFPEREALIRSVLNQWATWDAVSAMSSGGGLELARSLDAQRGFTVDQFEWLNTVRKRVAIYEVWYRAIVKGHVLRLPSGRVVEFDLKNDDHVTAVYTGQIQPTPAIFRKMRLAWWVGPHRISDEPSPYAHQHFPYVPFWGFREDLTGTPYGLIRAMLSPQDEINARRSKMLWLLNSKRAIVDGDAVLDHDKAMQEIGRPDAYVILNPNRQRDARFEISDGGQLATQQFQVLEAAKQEINQASGIYQSMLGQGTSASSGLAINSLIEQGSTTLAEINDNFRFAKRLVGEMLAELVREDLAGQIARGVKVGDPGEERTVVLNQPAVDPLGRQVLDNDVSKARFSIVLDEVPSSPTFRMQQLQLMTEMLKASPPQAQAVLYDIMVELMDNVPKKAEILKRLRTAMGVAQDGAPPDPEKMQMAQRMQELEQVIQEGAKELEKLAEETAIARVKLASKDEELGLRAREIAIKEADVALKAEGQVVDRGFRQEEAQAAREIAAEAGAPAAGGAASPEGIQQAVQAALQEALAPLVQQLSQLMQPAQSQGVPDGNS